MTPAGDADVTADRHQPEPMAETAYYRAGVAVLTAMGLARAIPRLEKTKGEFPADWPHKDRAVRDEFHARWTWLMQMQSGLDPDRARVTPIDTSVPTATEERVPLLTAQDEEAIRVRYVAGETGLSLAECFEVHSSTIYKVLARAGIERRVKWMEKRVTMETNRAEAVRMYAENRDRDRIAATLKVTRAVVNRYLRDSGIVLDMREIKTETNRRMWQRKAELRRAA